MELDLLLSVTVGITLVLGFPTSVKFGRRLAKVLEIQASKSGYAVELSARLERLQKQIDEFSRERLSETPADKQKRPLKATEDYSFMKAKIYYSEAEVLRSQGEYRQSLSKLEDALHEIKRAEEKHLQPFDLNSILWTLGTLGIDQKEKDKIVKILRQTKETDSEERR